MKQILTSLLMLVSMVSFSQGVIKGKVKDSSTGEPLIGVNVLIKSTGNGTVSNIAGDFALEASKGDTLIFSYIGFEKMLLPVENETIIEVALKQDVQQLSEVVVTALGIKKQVKALGYAVQEVEGESLEKAKEPNIINSLSGRVAGLTIQNSTDLFQNPGISLRGETPLLVIDGIPDRTLDIWKINSDDIESVSVLKGATASALYGSVGRSGAIMITTKKAKKGKINVSINNSTMFQPSFIKVPKVQTQYGNGNQGVYAYVDGSGAGTEGGGWIWGPKLDQRDPSTTSGFVETTQYNSPRNPETGELIPIPYISRGKDNIDNFFRNGLIQSNNISVGWGNDVASIRTSISNVYQKGIVPNTDLENFSFNLASSLKPIEKLTVTSNITFNKQYTENFPETGYGPTNYLYNLVLWTGTDVDVRDLRAYWVEGQEGFQQKHFNISYYNNPYFQAYEYLRAYNKNSVFGNTSFVFNITDELSVRGRTGVNIYSLERTYIEPKSYIGYGAKSLGNFTIQNENYFDVNSDIGLKYEKTFNRNFTLNAEAAYVNYFRGSNSNRLATDGLNIPGFNNVSNNAGTSLFGSNREENEAINSFYAFADLEFFNSFYVSLTGRTDKVSTLPKESNTFFYPSASGSLVISNLIDFPKWFTFAKARGSWARVSEGKIGDDPYSFIMAYNKGTTWNGVPSASFGNSLLSSDLQPETSDTWEVGTLMRFFNNRLNVDVAYYEARDYNNLIYSPISETTGYQSILLNGDEYRRKGIEATIGITSIATNHFEWNTSVNLSRNRRYQEAIFGDREQTADLIKKGERTDRIFAEVYQTNSQGQVIFENGFPLRDPYRRYVGNDNPDLTYGITNTFRYKNFQLSFLFDGRIGGLMYSTTNQKMWWGGTEPGTVNQFRDDANNGESTYIGNGVEVTGGEITYDINGNITSDTRTFAPNETRVNYISFMQSTSNNHNSNYHYYEETFIKLRELTLTYNFSEKLLNKTPFNGLSASFVGRNLWLASKIPNVDPDSGVDNLQAPSTRNIGFNINAKF
ncbi:SusC/RagA family TonB-linked outer membrane protein [Marivirga lumbricoides]|uniref:SusC/RagA family TonB-linked outer membrane protein n=1 Tax=Marivirga lumbricoides TaxID=1046115 RepID=A0ABQ1N0Z7_9BACT|nr:SusC/RagA family TonB-linked outer membrane protein [Marivirga lumbricoides]